jgi:hypothetical protein
MNAHSREHDRLTEDLLSHTRLSPPSAELKKRVLGAAREAWNTGAPASADVSWRFPLFRLAASIALTFVLVRFANDIAHREVAPWQPTPQATAPAFNMTASSPDTMAPLAAIAAALEKKNQVQRLRIHVQQIQALSDATADTSLEQFNPTS